MGAEALHTSGGESFAGVTSRGGSDSSVQERLDRLRDELVACQRLAAVGNLSAIVAHEFNNLMTAVLARSEDALAQDDIALMRKALDRTVTNSRKAIDITRHLLDFAAAEPLPLEPCRLREALDEAVATTARPFDKDGIELRVSIPDDVVVQARRILLEQLLLNLLLNARQAIDRSGVISVSARPEGACVSIELRDTGRGFSADDLTRLVNPFLAATPDTPATWRPDGFGLSACRTIAQQHGATIECVANPDRGVTFRVLWPATSGS